MLPSNPENASFGWFIGHSQLVIRGLKPHEIRNVEGAIRFGSGPAEQFDVYALASDAYKLYGASKPLQFEWLDRRPIAMLFIAGGQAKSVDNINAYLPNTNPPLNFSQPGESARFRELLHQFANKSLSTMASMQPQAVPQAVILWDMEGEGDP